VVEPDGSGALVLGCSGARGTTERTARFNGAFTAAPGYDKVTGVGTIDAANLIKAY
jgi:hypothetical protein